MTSGEDQRLTTIQSTTPLIHSAPIEEFCLIKQTPHWGLFCFKFIDLVDLERITITKQQIKFSLFDLYFLDSLSILSAYLFFIPVCEVSINPYYLKLVLPSVKHFDQFNNTKLLFQDNKITVFHSDDGACLISQSGLKRVIRSIMVRRSEKNISEERDV